MVTAGLLALGGTIQDAAADHPVFYAREGAAISGYDTVAYFTMGKPVLGEPDIAVKWKGAVWLFSSMAHRDKFEADPRSYAPQYGGYCAYGTAMGVAKPTDPQAWKIVDGKLYLMNTPGVLNLWLRDVDGTIQRSNLNWPAILAE